jgi:hypothetical protein
MSSFSGGFITAFKVLGIELSHAFRADAVASGFCIAAHASAPLTVSTTSCPFFFSTPARTVRDVKSSSAISMHTTFPF